MKNFFLAVFCSFVLLSDILAQNLKVAHVLKHNGIVYNASFSPDNRLILTGCSDKVARIWDKNSGSLLQVLNGHTGPVSSAVFSPDGRLIITASYDKKDKNGILWESSTGRKIRTLTGHYSGINDAAFSPNGEYIATASLDFSIIIWRGRDGKYERTLKGHPPTIGSAGVTGIKFSPDSRLLVSIAQERIAKIWDVSTGILIHDLQGHNNAIKSVDFSSDSKYLLTGSTDRTAKIWDVSSGKIVLDVRAHSSAGLQTVRFIKNDSLFITSAWDQKVKLWNTSTGELKRTFSTNGVTAVGSIKNEDICLTNLSSDESMLITASNSNRPEIWDVNSGNQIFSLVRHEKRALSALISSDGLFALTASMDGNAILWQFPISDEQEVKKPTSPPSLEVVSVHFVESQQKDGVLGANEQASINAVLINKGKGQAYGLSAYLKSNGSQKGISLPGRKSFGNLMAGDSLKISLPISSNLNVEDGKLELDFEITEANYFNADPIRITLNTQKFQSPAVVVADHKFSNNQGGRIRLGQTVTLELLIQNKGQGKASGINVLFKNPPNVFPGSENPMSIASLQPNETKILSYEFFANKAFAEKEIPIEVTISESYGKFGSNQTVRVSLDQTLQQTKTVIVSNQAQEAVKIDEVFLKAESKPLPPQPEDLATEIKKTGKPVFYSLFIGINDYEYASAKLPNLDKPIADAEALNEALTSKYEFSKENSVILKNPTRSEIINSLENLARKVTSKDNLLIFYAGHGLWDERLKKGYWLPADSQPDDVSSWIPNSTIKDYIAGIQSKHTLLITDACFGGGIFKTRDVGSEINDYAFSKIYRLASRKAMTSGTLTTVPDDSKFMRSLLKQLAEFDGEYLTSRKLFDDLYTAVVNNTNSVPQFGVIQETGDEGGDFIFIRKK